MFNILLLADRASVANDLKLTSGDAIRAAGSGVSTIQRLVDTMRQFISSGRWTPNVPQVRFGQRQMGSTLFGLVPLKNYAKR
ncbi:hypothetical protein J4727_00440 [Providencia rettgeri]|uniref:Uncharacterized protein n=1 Tax=Providencia rettgeri TaxID=587 RepID=A0A939SQC1_PRORE|nr:hypothetical protein [Providencia rettgeri]